MKTNIFGVMIALVTVLTMVIGSASIVIAKGPPSPTGSVEITSIFERESAPGWLFCEHIDTWSHCKANRIVITVYDDTVGEVVTSEEFAVKGKKKKIIITDMTDVEVASVGASVNDTFTVTVKFYDGISLLVTATDQWN
jgi:hypothetical protein